MAKITEKVFEVKLSKLVKNGDGTEELTAEDFGGSLESIIEEMVGEGIVVEVTDLDVE